MVVVVIGNQGREIGDVQIRDVAIPILLGEVNAIVVMKINPKVPVVVEAAVVAAVVEIDVEEEAALEVVIDEEEVVSVEDEEVAVDLEVVEVEEGKY